MVEVFLVRRSMEEQYMGDWEVVNCKCGTSILHFILEGVHLVQVSGL